MRKFLVMSIFIFGVSGCCNKLRYCGPIESKSDVVTFFKPYKKALTEVGGNSNEALVQLGFPTANKIKIWYSLSHASKKPKHLRVDLNGKRVSSSQIKHYWNTIYKTGIVEVTKLSPDTTYRVSISSSNLNNKKLLLAKTLPAKTQQKSVRFLFGSCFQPFTYKPDAGQNIGHINTHTKNNLRNFAARAKSRDNKAPLFTLFLGDQIYTDPGADGDTVDLAYLHGNCSEYIRGKVNQAPDYLAFLHRYHFAIPDMHEVLSSIPSVMMWDDHDIRDGWGSQGDEAAKKWQSFFSHAKDAFVAFQGVRNLGYSSQSSPQHWQPALPVESDIKSAKTNSMHHSFEYGVSSFFMMDGRSKKNGQFSLGEKQKKDILKWLKSRGNTPTVFVLSCPVPIAIESGRAYEFGKLYRKLKDDIEDRMSKEERTWLFSKLVKHFKEHKNQKLLILAGDVHYSGISDLYLKDENGERVFGYEVVSSGIAQSEFKSVQAWLGGFYGESKDVANLRTRARGFHSGPCFAEIGIQHNSNSTEAPKIELMFYPEKIMADLGIQPTDLVMETLPSIENRCYFPENQTSSKFLSREQSKSQLDEGLKRYWRNK